MLSARTFFSPRTVVLRLALIASGSLLMALSARLAINVGPPGFSVPITGQTLALPLIVAALGREQATLAMFAYLAEGLMGLPVFSSGGAGLLKLLGPSGGYLLAYPVVAFVLGTLFDRGWGETYLKRALAIFASTAIVFVFGVAWLTRFPYVGGLGGAIALGLTPFIIGDIAKVLVAAGLGPQWTKIAARLRL